MQTYLVDSCRDGRFLLLEGDMISQFMRVYGEWCPAEVDLYLSILAARPGNILEVGSHIGTHTIPLARALLGTPHSVTALEPQRIIFQLLCANVALNAVTNVHASQTAAGADWKEAEALVGDYDIPFNYGAFSTVSGLDRETKYPGPVHDEPFPIGPVDGLNPGNLSLLKVDCEGDQDAVLDGAVRTLKNDRPVLVIESPEPRKAPVLIRRIESFGYDCYWLAASRYAPDNPRQLYWALDARMRQFDVSLVCVSEKDDRWLPKLNRAHADRVDNVELEVMAHYGK